jgi:dipeptidyl aminopeptidase/acylaminoacyl peptidase
VDREDVLQGTIADRYHIEREIGAGGMAIVYLARDLRHHRAVAIKVLKQQLSAALGVERFLSEIKVTANLQHPNLLPLFDSGEAGGRLFYVMPYIAGESLRARLERERQLPIDDAIHIASAVAAALDYAHRQGVIHRDLKPENILLHEGQPLVADFGIALAASHANDARLTQTGHSLGTPSYMSPEQAVGEHEIDSRTDVYSLGAVLYEMLTGEAPHTGKTAAEIMAKVLAMEPRGIREIRPSVPAHVEAVVNRALKKLPADRFSSAHEFAEELKEKADDAAVSRLDSGAHTDSGSQARALSAPRTRSLRWIAAAVALLGAFAVGGWLMQRRATPVPTVRFMLALAPDERVVDPGGIVIAASPAGDRFAYLATRAGGVRKLVLRGLADLRGKEVPGSEEASSPFFSPGGEWIGFISRGQLKKVRAGGGAPVIVSEITGPTYGATWLPDGQMAVSVGNQLLLVPAAGGSPRAAVRLDSSRDEAAQRWPLALSDGEHILFGSFPRAGVPGAKIGVASIKTGATRLLDLAGTCPVAVMDGLLIYSSASGQLLAVPFDENELRVTGSPVAVVDEIVVGPGGGSAKAAASRSGSLIYLDGRPPTEVVVADTRGNLRPLLADSADFGFPRFSPDGKRVAMAQLSSTRTDVWIYTLASGTLQRLTTEGTLNDRPEWTPDSRRVLFRSNRFSKDRKMAVWWQPADGSGPAELLFSAPGHDVSEGVLSPDGRTLVARVTDAHGDQIVWSHPLEGDTASRVLVRSDGLGPRISPDGRWLAYASDESGGLQVYVTPLDGPQARYQVSTDGGFSPLWSPDGRRLMYAKGQQVIGANLRFAPAFEVVDRQLLFDGSFEFNPSHASFDVSPDGKQFLLPKSQGANARMIVVYNWREELASVVRTAQR